MKFFSVIFTLSLLISTTLIAQTGKIHHVTSTTLNVRKGPSIDHAVIHTFKQYDNLVPLESTSNGWVKVKVNGIEGYVSGKYLKTGKAVVSTTSSYRTGAICRDGTRSSATGRGACSHHGGVDRWTYAESTSVRIVEE